MSTYERALQSKFWKTKYAPIPAKDSMQFYGREERLYDYKSLMRDDKYKYWLPLMKYLSPFQIYYYSTKQIPIQLGQKRTTLFFPTRQIYIDLYKEIFKFYCKYDDIEFTDIMKLSIRKYEHIYEKSDIIKFFRNIRRNF